MNKSTVEKGYDSWSEEYDSFDNPMIVIDEMHFPEVLGDIRDLKVLDLGCGSGRYSLKLAKAGAIVTGIDISSGMLEKAELKTKDYKVEFIKHDIQSSLPFEDNSFDMVIASLVFEHIKDLSGIFIEIKRVLKPGGKFKFSEMHPAMFYKNIQAHYTDEETGEEVVIGSYRRSMSDFINPLLAADFKIEFISEHCCDNKLITLIPKARKHEGYPMIFIMQLIRSFS